MRRFRMSLPGPVRIFYWRCAMHHEQNGSVYGAPLPLWLFGECCGKCGLPLNLAIECLANSDVVLFQGQTDSLVQTDACIAESHERSNLRRLCGGEISLLLHDSKRRRNAEGKLLLFGIQQLLRKYSVSNSSLVTHPGLLQADNLIR